MSINRQLCGVTKSERQKILSILSLYPVFSGVISRLSIKRNTIAFINKVYIIGDRKSIKYVLRESHMGANLNHIKLEIEVLDYLQKRRFKLAPFIIVNKSGEKVIKKFGRYYILQTFMPGSAVANWDNLSKFNLSRLKSFFVASADFSRTVKDFRSNSKTRSLGLADYVNDAEKWLSSRLATRNNNPGLRLLKKYSTEIGEFIIDTRKDFGRVGYDKLPKQLVHFDLHPGNVNYIGNKVSGIFDFDWVRFDNRISDFAGAVAQSCYYFGGLKGGLYRRDRIRAGIKIYRRAYGDSEFTLNKENKLLLVALKGCIVFQLMFTCDWYLRHVGSRRHFIGLEHFIKLIIRNDFVGLI